MSSEGVAAHRACTTAERCEAIEQLGALQAELLDVVTAAHLENDWAADGATCTEAQLMYQLRVGHHTAKEWVRVGSALQDLPAIREAFTSPFGHRLRSKPRPLRSDVRRRTGGLLGRDLGTEPPAA